MDTRIVEEVASKKNGERVLRRRPVAFVCPQVRIPGSRAERPWIGGQDAFGRRLPPAGVSPRSIAPSSQNESKPACTHAYGGHKPGQILARRRAFGHPKLSATFSRGWLCSCRFQ
jgi:hypothetical protein